MSTTDGTGNYGDPTNIGDMQASSNANTTDIQVFLQALANGLAGGSTSSAQAPSTQFAAERVTISIGSNSSNGETSSAESGLADPLQAREDEGRLAGPGRGVNVVEDMIDKRDANDGARAVGPDAGDPGMALNMSANAIAFEFADGFADKTARDSLTEQAKQAGLTHEDAERYADNVVSDAKDIRADNPELSSREVAERAVARNGSAFGDSSIDAEQNNPGYGDSSVDAAQNSLGFGDSSVDAAQNNPGIGDSSVDAEQNSPGIGDSSVDAEQNSPGSDGGSSRVICTYFYQKGMLTRLDWAADLRFTQQNLSEQTVRGYHVWAIPTVRLMRSGSPTGQMIEKVMHFVALHRAQELAFQMNRRDHGDVVGKAIRCVMEPLCWSIGAFAGKQRWQSLYRDSELLHQ